MAAENGGAIWMYPGSAGLTSITESAFEENETLNGDGSIIYYDRGNNSTQSPLTIDNGTFSNNQAFGDGGIYLDSANSRVTIRDSNFISNGAGGVGKEGGAIYVRAGLHSIIDSAFVNNSAYACGALSNHSVLTLIDTSFASNSTTSQLDDAHGGALCNYDFDLTMFGGAIRDNRATNGGGLYNDGEAILNRVTVSGNSAESTNAPLSFPANGGGIYNVDSLTASNSTFSANSAISNGGGIFNLGSATINFSTITNNTADSGAANAGDGGGLFLSDGSMTLSNSILAANHDASSGMFDLYMPDCGKTLASNLDLTSGSYNIIGYSNCPFDGDTTGDEVGTSASPLDPQLGVLDSNGGTTQTHLPTNSSPAIDNVSDTSRCTGLFANIDQRGYTRPAGSGCDSGAVEIDGVPTAVAINGQPSVISDQPVAVFAWLAVLLGAQFTTVLAKRAVSQKRHQL